MRVLAGDIGGTYARLALVELAAQIRILAEQTTPSQEAGSLTTLAQQFLAGAGERPERACFGIAGPVVNGEVSATNLPWHLSERALGDALGIPGFRLINDFEAAAHGVLRLDPHDWMTLQAGTPDPQGAIALIGAGTGLGEGFLVRAGDGYSVQASEGGHATFAAESEREWALFNYLSERYGHVSWERVVSGPGLVDIFEFLSAGQESAPLEALRKEMAEEAAGAVITRHALAESDSLAAAALELFAAAYGAQAGNLALTVLATGGLYLGGGIARHIAPKLPASGFMTAFRRKGRLAPLLERIPVRVILNADVGLIGAAVVAGKLTANS
jgi:glucokinase